VLYDDKLDVARSCDDGTVVAVGLVMVLSAVDIGAGLLVLVLLACNFAYWRSDAGRVRTSSELNDAGQRTTTARITITCRRGMSRVTPFSSIVSLPLSLYKYKRRQYPTNRTMAKSEHVYRRDGSRFLGSGVYPLLEPPANELKGPCFVLGMRKKAHRICCKGLAGILYYHSHLTPSLPSSIP
jgi:hypothetical protein